MAGGSMKDIKRRIKSVESTMQITKAMELVASSKLRKAKEKVEQSRPYFNIIRETIQNILENTRITDSPYTVVRPVKRSLFIVVAGDRGLAGGYNSNLLKAAVGEMQGKDPVLITVGRKSQEFFAKRGHEILANFPHIAEDLNFVDTAKIVGLAMDAFDKKQVDEAFICYTEFVSSLSQVPRIKRLLPLVVEGEVQTKRGSFEYEPSPGAVFHTLVPRYLEGIVYSTIVDAYAAEQGARRTAMESATDNASEMIENLDLQYNRARQAAITQEISEIVGGADALQ
ncbi:MAG: ATP synthase F1 subunit gamma [Peptostreptococcaceae bacterium]|nr:ATP synthase F1 subunit gamma [Peptostreptococcaceae bacterium]